jgi:hypothetical protein
MGFAGVSEAVGLCSANFCPTKPTSAEVSRSGRPLQLCFQTNAAKMSTDETPPKTSLPAVQTLPPRLEFGALNFLRNELVFQTRSDPGELSGFFGKLIILLADVALHIAWPPFHDVVKAE